jgi:CO/xanthine dehydrogenase Mo-binding subunit
MMETYRAFTYMDHMERLVVVSSTQVPFHVRRHMARILNIPSTRVRVIKPRIGGGFGGKQTVTAEIFTSVVTMKTGKPAIIVYDRKETFESSTTRHAMRVKVRIGATREGIVKAIDIAGLSDTGAYGEHASTVFGLVAQKTFPLYNKTEAVRFIGDVVYTNKTPGGAFRGYGATQGTLAVETALNKLAEALDMDPTALRLKNLIKEGETNLLYNGLALGSSTLHECVRRGKALIGWDEKYPRVELGGGKVRGYGMAVTMQGSGIAGIDTASVEIRLNDDGNYALLVGSTDMGTGSDTILAQMAAEILETEMDHITVHAADTDVSPYDPGSYASSTTYVTGMAVVKACQKLRTKIISQGAKFLGVSKEDVTFDGDVVRVHSGYASKDPEYIYAHSSQSGHLNPDDEAKSIDLKKISELTLTWTGKSQLTGTATFGSNISPPPFIAGFAEVEVDLETGEVKLIQSVNVVDCGTAINPNLVRVQTEGGAVQGIGMALFESVQHDSRGALMNNSFMQYKIPARNDFGKLVVELVESYEPTGPFGAKSVGEVVANTAAPAIVDAVYHATGVRVTTLPITAEKVYLGMRQAKSEAAGSAHA